MNLRKKLWSAVAVALGLSGVSAIATAPGVGAVNCPSGHSCIWEDTSYQTNGSTSARVEFELYIPNFEGWNYAGTSNDADNISSVSNKGNFQRAYYYVNDNCDTFAFSLAIDTGDGNLGNSTGNAPGGYNDQLESGAFDTWRDNC